MCLIWKRDIAAVMKYSQDRYRVAFDPEGYGGAPAIADNAQAGRQIIPAGSALREGAKPRQWS
jgi:hypothetical protein